MLHVITVHHLSDRWIPVQLGYLARNLTEPYRTYASLEGIDRAWHDRFDVVAPTAGKHAGKLNHLARLAVTEADADDLLVFLDGDAFPIADPMPTVRAALDHTALVAVRRDENVGDVQPHPSFCAVPAATWIELGGDWSNGASWTNATGREISDVGGNLRWQLATAGLEWTPLLRSNRLNLHPIWFALYADIVYHHGAGFRRMVSRHDQESAGGRRGRRLRVALGARSARRRSEEVFAHLRRDPEFYRRFQ
jgi:hypothetical protein